MYSYTFLVDKALRLCSWDKNLETVRNKSFAEIQGKPYYEVLPRLFEREADAVSKVISDGTPLTLTGYQVSCFYGAALADIIIEPVIENGDVIGAKVKTDAYPACSPSQLMQQSQLLIDIGKMSSTLAHGIRNPLNAIKGAVVYLNDKYKHETKLVEFTQIIEEEISKLDNFITRFLGTSFTDSEMSDNDLNLLLDEILSLTTLQAHSNKISFSKEYAVIPPVKLDTFHFKNAILNIINNAIEAMPAGGVITVQTSTLRSNDRNFIALVVTDTGPGMSDNKMKALALPVEGHGARKGRGFGLFITREIIQHHGGHLEIDSAKGIGTSVKIYLPIESL